MAVAMCRLDDLLGRSSVREGTLAFISIEHEGSGKKSGWDSRALLRLSRDKLCG